MALAVLAMGGHTLSVLREHAGVTPAPQAASPGFPAGGLTTPTEIAPPIVSAVELPATSVAEPESKPPETALPGGLGPLGPITGPLNTELGEADAVVGPTWDRKPLPGLAGAQTGAVVPAAPGSGDELSSEIPDQRLVELSRLANPPAESGKPVTRAPGKATAENPLTLKLDLGRAAAGCRAGEAVTVRLSANLDCYLAVIRVDATGTPAMFRSPAPSRSFACVLRAGPELGSEYLLAVGSVQPLSGSSLAAALRESGITFAAPQPASEGGLSPGNAWTAVVNYAAALPGTSKAWARHDWAAAIAGFGTLRGDRVAESRPSPQRSEKAAAGEQSVLPPETKKEP